MNLSEIEPLQVMLSSRASEKVIFEAKLQEISVLRRTIKSDLESLKIGKVSLFKVRIHEGRSVSGGRRRLVGKVHGES
jgi:hypothetical protein